jgi:hypothetical protein
MGGLWSAHWPGSSALKHRHAVARRVLHPLVVMNVAEQQVAAFLPPDRAFGGPLGATEAIGLLLDGLGRGNDLVQLWSELADTSRSDEVPPAAVRRPRPTCTDAAAQVRDVCCRQRDVSQPVAACRRINDGAVVNDVVLECPTPGSFRPGQARNPSGTRASMRGHSR